MPKSVFLHYDESLLQNRTYLYHIVGNKTGEWRVPVGGMGMVVNSLLQRATQLGVSILTEAEVKQLALGSDNHTIGFEKDGKAMK